jgi:NitT/TauT family transport system permease protein
MKRLKFIIKNRYIIFSGLIFAILIIWELGARNTDAKIFISTPSHSFNYFIQNYQPLFTATGITFVESLTGLLIATVFSFGIMIICLYIPKLMEFVLPIMVTSQVIPLVTLAPLFALIFDIGLTAKIMMAALLCFFPILVNFANGVNLIPKNINELMFIYNISTTQRIFRFYFPLSLPSIMTGLKVSSTLSVIGAIMAEFCGSKQGLGKNLFLASKRLNPELMINSLILSAILGGLMYGLVYLTELKLGSWYKRNAINGK